MIPSVSPSGVRVLAPTSSVLDLGELLPGGLLEAGAFAVGPDGVTEDFAGVIGRGR